MKKTIWSILGILLLLVIIWGIMNGPKYLRAMEIAEKNKMEYIEDTFINMDEYFMYQEVEKAPKPFIFPKVNNIQLPETFEHDGQSFDMMGFLDSSYTQGFLVIQNDTIENNK